MLKRGFVSNGVMIRYENRAQRLGRFAAVRGRFIRALSLEDVALAPTVQPAEERLLPIMALGWLNEAAKGIGGR